MEVFFVKKTLTFLYIFSCIVFLSGNVSHTVSAHHTYYGPYYGISEAWASGPSGSSQGTKIDGGSMTLSVADQSCGVAKAKKVVSFWIDSTVKTVETCPNSTYDPGPKSASFTGNHSDYFYVSCEGKMESITYCKLVSYY